MFAGLFVFLRYLACDDHVVARADVAAHRDLHPAYRALRPAPVGQKARHHAHVERCVHEDVFSLRALLCVVAVRVLRREVARSRGEIRRPRCGERHDQFRQFVSLAHVVPVAVDVLRRLVAGLLAFDRFFDGGAPACARCCAGCVCFTSVSEARHALSHDQFAALVAIEPVHRPEMSFAELRLLPWRDRYEPLADADPVARHGGTCELQLDVRNDADGQVQQLFDRVVDMRRRFTSVRWPWPAERHAERRHDRSRRRDEAAVALRSRVRLVQVEGVAVLQRLAPVADQVLVDLQRRRFRLRLFGQGLEALLRLFGQVIGDVVQRHR